jgi:tryptophanyl-tRNA synthetase
MSKSYDNGIYLDDTVEQVEAKVKSMITDTTRIRKSDPGHPETCNVCHYQTIFNAAMAPELHEGCRTATIGCMDSKRALAQAINDLLEPMRQRRAYYESRPDEVMDIIRQGNARAREEAQKTMEMVRDRLNLANDLSDIFPSAREHSGAA